MAPAKWLENPKIQGIWFVADIMLASATLYWIQQPTSDLYLVYFLVIFGTAITRSMVQSFLVALLATLIYSYLSWQATLAPSQEFWLRVPFLWIVASFTGLLSQESRDEEKMREETYRERLFHLERLAVLGQVAAEIAHRIKAPLTTIRVNAEVLARQKDFPQKRLGELTQIQREVDHCKEVLQKLLSMGRIEELETAPMDLKHTIRSILMNVQPLLSQRKIELITDGLDGKGEISGDVVLLGEAISAVIQNAIEAMPAGGRMLVSIAYAKPEAWWRLKIRKPGRWEVRIQDTGIGIVRGKLETIFRPFFTTKKDKGNGLGLSSALRIFDKHGGSISVESAGEGKGACFILSLPDGPSHGNSENQTFSDPRSARAA
jgi:signal transduction histidine kinase